VDKIARVLVTTECNLKCHYCCNKMPEIQASFKMTTMGEFLERANEYSGINISGGEPLLAVEKTCTMIRTIKNTSSAKVYIYTNAMIRPYTKHWKTLSLLDGVNIGVHGNFDNIKTNILVWIDILKTRAPNLNHTIRVHVQDIKCTPEIVSFCNQNGITLYLWELNNCNKIQEDRYIL